MITLKAIAWDLHSSGDSVSRWCQTEKVKIWHQKNKVSTCLYIKIYSIYVHRHKQSFSLFSYRKSSYKTRLKPSNGAVLAFLPLQRYVVFSHCNVPCVDIVRDMFISVPLGPLRSVYVRRCRHVAADRFIKKRTWQTAGELATGHRDLTSAAPRAASWLLALSLAPSVGSRLFFLIKRHWVFRAPSPGFIPFGMFGDACPTFPGKWSNYLALFCATKSIWIFFENSSDRQSARLVFWRLRCGVGGISALFRSGWTGAGRFCHVNR